MNNSFKIYKKFPTKEQADELKVLLESKGIVCETGDNLPPVDITFSGSSIQHQYEVRISSDSFQKADEILEQEAEYDINNIDPDYYLFDFTNEELYEILIKPDEWNALDYKLAQTLLKKRGESINSETLTRLKKERLDKLATPEKGQTGLIFAGYLFALLGGFIGVIIGYLLWKSKKTLPNGERVFNYTKSDRKQGVNIFYLSILTICIYTFIKFLAFI